MKFGDRTLRLRSKGKDVAELQLRLAGFSGTVWDGDFGNNTKNQVIAFQRDYMNLANQTGIVDASTYTALDVFANQFPIDFRALGCPSKTGSNSELCECEGFGQNRFKKIYKISGGLKWSRTGKQTFHERLHQYEYPGIHKAALHTYRAFLFYATDPKFRSPHITSGYRCHINNTKPSKRGSTNHMGKAIDFTFKTSSRNAKQNICNNARDLLVEKSNCQIRWNKRNQKALEPGFPARGREFIAATWVHLDVRQYDEKFLADRFFVNSSKLLDNKDLGED